jgi:hypothetical protein
MSVGVVFLHLVPSTLLSHVEWTLSGITGDPTRIQWVQNDSRIPSFRGVSSFLGPEGSAAIVASAFMNLKQLCFEVIQQPSADAAGARWCFTPGLGMFHCATDEAGNLVVNENQLRLAVERAGSNALKLQAEIRKLLGQAWDDELEPFRELVGGTESNHGVVSAEAERVGYGQNIRPV